mgnify:CR=1 FL=1
MYTPGEKVLRTPQERFEGLPDYPFEPNHISINDAGLGELRMHYLDEGDGPVILMLHGNPTWSFYYRNLVLALRDRYRCIVPDHIGCGLSDKPGDDRYDYRLESLPLYAPLYDDARFQALVQKHKTIVAEGTALSAGEHNLKYHPQPLEFGED